MRTILALSAVSAALAFSSVAAMAQQTPKQTPATPPANQIDSVRTPDEKSLVEFWTPERLREARPTPVPRVDPNSLKK